MLRPILRPLWPALLLTAMLSACADSANPRGSDLTGGSTTHQQDPATTASLPLVSHLRYMSAATANPLLGNAALLRSPGAKEDGSRLDLDASINGDGGGEEMEWAVYGLDPGCNLLTEVTVFLGIASGSQAWVGLADFEGEAWAWFGPYGGDAVLEAGEQRYLSPSGLVYCAVVAAPSSRLGVEALEHTRVPLTGQPVVVADSSGEGMWTSMLIVDGCPAIAYWDPAREDLFYVRALTPCGTIWDEPVTLDHLGPTGMYPSMAMVDGFPTIAYSDELDNVLRYVRALDAHGDAWPEPSAISAPGTGGKYCALAVVEGRPAVAYLDGLKSELRFIRAKDAQGIAWNQAARLHQSVILNSEAKLQIVDGYPAVAYSAGSDWGVYFVRALDSEGNGWADPVKVNTNEDADLCGFLVSGGKPLIYYTYEAPSILRCTRGLDASGSTWSPAETVDEIGGIDWISMALISGKPAIAYSGGILAYRLALDVDGLSWSEPQSLDPSAPASTACSLISVDGVPAVSYMNAFTGNLRFVRGF